ncbi:hypothetical protein KKA00_03210, partial [bacterium]|nr:hypothetical protein [bacterium]
MNGRIWSASGSLVEQNLSKLDFNVKLKHIVMDQAGLEALAKAANGGPIKRPSDGGEVKSVVFVQCAGQRDET